MTGAAGAVPATPATPATPVPKPWRDAALLALGFLLLALAATYFGRQTGTIAVVWFPNALGMAFLTCRPLPRWPGLLAAAAVANLLANLFNGDTLALSAALLLPNALEMALGAALLRRVVKPAQVSDGAGALLRLMGVGALLPPLCSATLGAALLQWHGPAGFGAVWPRWYAASVIGLLAALPLSITLLNIRADALRAQLGAWPAWTLALLSVAVTWFALSHQTYPFVFIVLPLIAGALLLPPLTAYALVLLTMLTTAAALAFGHANPAIRVALGQPMFVLTAAMAALLPAQFLLATVERLRQQARMLTGLSSASVDLSAFVDNDGIYRLVNRALERYWGTDRERMVGRSLQQLLPVQDFERRVKPALQRALAGETVSIRADVNFPTLGWRTMEVTYQPAFDSDQVQTGVVFTGHDVTELVQTQRSLERSLAELRAAHESLEQFVRIASHDLREPLNTITQFCALLRADHPAELSAPAAQYLGHVEGGATRMRTLLDDLLAFVRLEPVQALALQPVAISAVLATAQQALAARITACGASIELAPSVLASPRVLGQAGLLGLLFQNLLSNAIKFVPAERVPQVRISIGTGIEAGAVDASANDDDTVSISIADNGIGIPVAQQPLLFVPFKRLHSRRKYEGTGLGLAIAKRIAEAHGGSIRIAPDAAQGSRFVVTLRRAG